MGTVMSSKWCISLIILMERSRFLSERKLFHVVLTIHIEYNVGIEVYVTSLINGSPKTLHGKLIFKLIL